MRDWRLLLFGALALAVWLDITGEGIMTLGILFGWIIGLMTVTQWNLRKKKKVTKK